MGIKTSYFQIDYHANIETVWQSLEDLGCSLLYSEEDENDKKIFGNLPPNLEKTTLLAQFPHILCIESIELPEIDWENQWSTHQTFHEGHLYVDLTSYAAPATLHSGISELKLLPGPGFGDHSHPTTRLVLKLMSSLVTTRNVLDLGCGSGILSLAAIAMGAKNVQGIDIDEEAIEHSKKNSQCNGMVGDVEFIIVDQLKAIEPNTVLLINMIQSEQDVALESLSDFQKNLSMVVSSGVLMEERRMYLERCAKRGWQLIKEETENGWLGFVFERG